MNLSTYTVGIIENKLSDRLAAIENAIADEAERERFRFDLSGFKKLHSRFLHQLLERDRGVLQWHKVRPLQEDRVFPHSSLPTCSEDDIQGLLNKLVVLKLNGGLGMTMGCKGPKSLLEVRDQKSFLDLTVEQLEFLNNQYDVQVPLVLMNSFNTDVMTREVIEKYNPNNVNIYTFCQKKYPRLSKDTLLPLNMNKDPSQLTDADWYPPGHGDVFDSFYRSPLFAKLRAAGKEYVFISNIDNLGATVDLNILSWLDQQKTEFCMESTNKTRSDVKGGTLVEYENRTRLLEIGQVPPDKIDEFRSIKKFKLFNTNNLWVRLDAVEKAVLENALDLDLIVNQETTPDGGLKVIHLETACGSAIPHFRSVIAISVPRSRFLPVKSTSDLFVVQSNLYNVYHGTLTMNPRRVELMGEPSVPHVKLGDAFRMVDSYMERVPSVPNMLELEHLTVSGNVTFGVGCALKGTVIIVAKKGESIDIPAGSILENKVISGSLFIVDH